MEKSQTIGWDLCKSAVLADHFLYFIQFFLCFAFKSAGIDGKRLFAVINPLFGSDFFSYNPRFPAFRLTFPIYNFDHSFKPEFALLGFFV